MHLQGLVLLYYVEDLDRYQPAYLIITVAGGLTLAAIMPPDHDNMKYITLQRYWVSAIISMG